MSCTRLILIVVTWLALSGTGQAESFECSGETPDWTLEFDELQAQFAFPSPTNLDVMLITTPQAQEWPRALTLVGDRDTAIVLLENEICTTESPYRARILTQRGQRPYC